MAEATIETKKLKVRIEFDQDTENPAEYAGWKPVSFGYRHHNYEDPRSYVGNGEIEEKIEKGEAFWLSVYEHSGILWSLRSELPYHLRCPWDSVDVAGLLLWNGEEGEACPGEKSARAFIGEYTKWCNGECFGFNIDETKNCNECDQDIDESFSSCWGYIGMDHMLEEIRQIVAGHEIVEVVGEAAGELEPSDFEIEEIVTNITSEEG